MIKDDKINVMFFTPGLEMGGAERWILSLVKNFQKVQTKRIFVTLGHFDKNLLAEAEKFTEVIVNDWRIKDPNISALNYLSDIDVIISWGCSNLKEMTKNFKGPTIEVSHNDCFLKNHVDFLSISITGASHLVGVSKSAANSFPSNRHKDAVVLYNGIEPNRTVPDIGREKQRALWDIKQDQKVILFPSRLAAEKNPKLVIDSLKYLPQEYILVMVANGGLYEEYSLLANNRLKFIPPIPHIGDYFAAADVMVMSSFNEGMPLVLLEAWCAGLPTVSTRYETYKELLELHGDLSWSVPVGCDPKNLANALQKACGMRNDNRVKIAKETVLREYTVERMVDRWENYLAQILRKWSKSRFHLLKTSQFHMI